MSLPSPNLDDRKFQDIVDDVKRQIGLRCPEWTDHNVSDPGVTLIELFAWMSEMMLYRMNQVPEKNYIKFLEMIGVSLEPPAPAQTDLRFRLSRPIEDREGEEGSALTLRARETVAATVRTETEDAIEFATDADLRMVRPRLAHIFTVPAPQNPAESSGGEDDLPSGAADFVPGGKDFPLFGPIPRENDAVYFGFEADVSANLVELLVDCVQAAATGLDERYPAQVWEWWDGVEHLWRRLEVTADTTFGFNRSGRVELALPRGLVPRMLGGRRSYWVRCRYTTAEEDLPPIGVEHLRPSAYQKPPEIRSVVARVVGGTAPASNSATVNFEELGHSDGTPGQVFRLRNAPILGNHDERRRRGETLLVGEQGMPRGQYQAWSEVPDFSLSGPEDRHYVCDAYTGEISLGPSVPQPDDTPPRQHGAIPAKGLTLLFSAYRHGGGTGGNVKENQVRILKSSIPYISDVSNPRRADGGQNLESLERAKLRGRALLRIRDRAVTVEDFEYLARRASSAVGRARCVQAGPLHAARGEGGESVPPGVVRVLIVPALSDELLVPRPADLRVPARVLADVQAYLDERRLLTTVLEVGEPTYVFVSTDITLVADPHADPDQVARRVRERLAVYLHPLRGGPRGDGWPFRRALTLSDIYAQVQAATGVAFLLSAGIYVSRVVNREKGLFGPEQSVSNAEGVRIADNQLICTREHRIRVRPMSAVDTPEPGPSIEG